MQTENGLIGCITSMQNGRLDYEELKTKLGFEKLKMADRKNFVCMNEEDEIAWIDEENKSHAIEESIKKTHTYVKCNYKQSGCSCRILNVS